MRTLIEKLLTDPLWEHYSGKRYTVKMVTNQMAKDPKKYPPTVVYQSVDTGMLWSRPVSDWERSFKIVEID
ncbi:MAG: DUF1653 domain-containing protein [Neptuniibacter sp.]